MISCLLFFGAYLGFFAIWNQRWTARFTKWVLSDDAEARLGYYFVTAQFKNLQWSFEGLRPSELDEFVSTSTNISQFAEQHPGAQGACYSWLGFAQSNKDLGLPLTAHESVHYFDAWQAAQHGSRIRHFARCAKALVLSLRDDMDGNLF